MAEKLKKNPIHLGLGGAAEVETPITGVEWYADYGERRQADGVEGRLVAEHTFTKSWDSWEMHPNGAEVVLCMKGEMTLVQEVDGAEKRIRLTEGEYAINAPGVWHTADVAQEATAVFVTAGVGTQHRSR